LEGSLQEFPKKAHGKHFEVADVLKHSAPQPGEAAVVSANTDVERSRYLVVSDWRVCISPSATSNLVSIQAMLQACRRHERPAQQHGKARVATAAGRGPLEPNKSIDFAIPKGCGHHFSSGARGSGARPL